MKRYLLFKGDEHYPSGGWKDFIGDFDSIKAARKAIASCEWWQIVDTLTKEIVASHSLSDDE